MCGCIGTETYESGFSVHARLTRSCDSNSAASSPIAPESLTLDLTMSSDGLDTAIGHWTGQRGNLQPIEFQPSVHVADDQ